MIYTDINNLTNLVGKSIKCSQGTFLITSFEKVALIDDNYKVTEFRYFLYDCYGNTIVAGNEDDTLKQLLNFELKR